MGIPQKLPNKITPPDVALAFPTMSRQQRPAGEFSRLAKDMPVLLTLTAAAASYFISVSIVIKELGVGEGAIGWIFLSAIPFAMLCGLAAMFRKRKTEGWLILVGTVICSIAGFQGIYAAFYSNRPHDPWIVIFRPVAQVCLVLLTAVIATTLYFVKMKTLPGPPADSGAMPGPNQRNEPGAAALKP